MKWPGYALIVIGVIHTIFGVAAFRATLHLLIAAGVWNTINGEPEREMAFWFLYFGFVLMILGALLVRLAREGPPVPRFVGWALLAITLVGVLVMPASGFRLVLIPVGGLLLKSPAAQ